MHTIVRNALAAPLALFALTASPASADILYAVSGSDIIRLDTDTLATVVIGPHGTAGLGGLSFDSAGVLYGIDPFADTLVRVDPATGAATVIGSAGVGLTFSTGLASDPTTGLLYGISTIGAGFSSFLVTYDTLTGAASPVGETGAEAVVGMSFDSAGALWGLDGAQGRDELIAIDKVSGAAVTVGAPNGLGSLPSIGGFAIGSSGTFWALEAGSSVVRLVRIDAVTGVPTVVGNVAGLTSIVTGLSGLPEGGLVGIGSPYCLPAAANSTGTPGALAAFGSEVAADNAVTLVSTSLPPNQFGYYLNSQTQGFISAPGGAQGNLCVVGQVGRYNQQIGDSGPAGQIDLVLDLPNTPVPTGTAAIVAGETWNFQLWYRDLNPAATSNFTNGLSITFQ